MEPFDSWYKDQINKQEIQYNEADWNSLQSALDQMDSGRKRRRWGWLWWITGLSVLLVGGLVGTGYLLSGKDKPDQPDQSATPAIAVQAPYDREADAKLPGSSAEPSSGIAGDPGATGDRQDAGPASGERERIPSADRATGQLASAGLGAKQDNNHERPGQKVTEMKRGAGNPDRANRTGGASVASVQTDVSSDTESRQPDNRHAGSGAIVATDGTVRTKAEETAGKPAHSGPEDLYTRPAAEPIATGVEPVYADADPLMPLILPFGEFTHDMTIVLPEVEAQGTSARISKSPAVSWAHGPSAGVLLYPATQEGRLFIGGQAAYELSCRIGSVISIQSGLGALYRAGNFGYYVDSPQDIYGVTKTRQGFRLIPTAAYYAQIPVLVAAHAGNHQIGAGVRVLGLLATRGKLVDYRYEVSAADAKLSYESSTIQSGFIEVPGFKRWMAEWTLRYGYTMHNRWTAFVSAGWIPGGLANNSVPLNLNADGIGFTAATPQTSAPPFLVEDKWHIGLSLQYRFK